MPQAVGGALAQGSEPYKVCFGSFLLCWNLLCRPGTGLEFEIHCLCLLSVGVKGMCATTTSFVSFFLRLEVSGK